MANIDAPFGLKPVKDAFSGAYAGQINSYYIGPGDATELRVGDPVSLAGGSNPAIAGLGVASERREGEFLTITRATGGASNFLCGVVVGFEPTAVVGYERESYRKANEERIVLVMDDPDAEFEVQCASGTVPVAANMGALADLSVVGSTDVYGRSATELDLTSIAATGNEQVRITGLSSRIGNEMLEHAVVRVKINKHQLA